MRARSFQAQGLAPPSLLGRHLSLRRRKGSLRASSGLVVLRHTYFVLPPLSPTELQKR